MDIKTIKKLEELDIPAQLNIETDKLATTRAKAPINIYLLSTAFQSTLTITIFHINSRENYDRITSKRRCRAF